LTFHTSDSQNVDLVEETVSQRWVCDTVVTFILHALTFTFLFYIGRLGSLTDRNMSELELCSGTSTMFVCLLRLNDI